MTGPTAGQPHWFNDKECFDEPDDECIINVGTNCIHHSAVFSSLLTNVKLANCLKTPQ